MVIRNVGSKKSDGPKRSEKRTQNKNVRVVQSIHDAFKGTNGSGLKFLKKFTAEDVSLREVAVNKKIARVPLTRFNLKDLKAKLTSRRSILQFERNLKKQKLAPITAVRSTVNFNGISKKGTIVLNKNTKITNKTKEFPRNASGKFAKLPSSESPQMSKNKTLNRIIQKQVRNKLKIRLFPPKTYERKKKITNKATDESFETLAGDTPYHLSYYLQFAETNNDMFSWGKLNYKFQKLVTDVKNMKLPSPTWKIKVIIRQNKIYAVTFTNKSEVERSVSFTSENDNYKIVIDNEQAFLLGSPGAVNSSEDIEILLNIVENIEKRDPMILYK